MRLEDLRNPLPNIRKAYSPNFSNATNESSDEKGAAELNEWILPLLRLLVRGGKYALPASIPGVGDVIGNPFDPFGGEWDSNAGGDPNMDSPFDADGLAPTYDYGSGDGDITIDDPTPGPEYVPPMRDLDFGTFDGGLAAPSVGAPTG